MKKIIIALFALGFLLLPLNAYASSGISKSTTNGYLKLATSYENYRQTMVADNQAIVAAIATISNSKTQAKLTKIEFTFNQYLNVEGTSITKAQALLAKTTVTKADLKLARKYLGTAKKFGNRAHNMDKDLKHRLKNLKITI